MLADVVEACLALGPTFVVAPEGTPVGDGDRSSPTRARGQGAAVRVGLDAAVAAGGGAAVPRRQRRPAVRARRATSSRSPAPSPTAGSRSRRRPTGRRTRSRSPSPDLFAPVYGPGQRGALRRARAVAHGRRRRTSIDDVDTVADLERLAARVGPHTRAALATLLGAAA